MYVGAISSVVERIVCIDEVAGSIPASSILEFIHAI